jgi:hypothetical protein
MFCLKRSGSLSFGVAGFMFKFLSGILALGGLCWGLFVFVLVFAPGATELGYVVFLPGYFVTFEYLLRACWTPSIELRRFIWGSSAVVQGSWLVFYVLSVPIRGGIQLLATAWWTIAFGISVYALFKDVDPANLVQRALPTDETEKHTPPKALPSSSAPGDG